MFISMGDIRRAIKAYREGGTRTVYRRGFRYLFEHTHSMRDEAIATGHRRFVCEFFDSRAEYHSYLDEWKKDPLRSYLKQAVDTWEQHGMQGANNLYYLSLYAYIRSQSPDVIVETGVKDGWATFYTLAAMRVNQNKNGGTTDLYSVAPPDETWSYREGKQPGWIIPDELSNTNKWHLFRASYKQGLVQIIDSVETVDVFNHDSIHTTSHMLCEFELAETYIDDGIIISDNIYDSMAFYYFTRDRACTSAKIAGGSDLDHYWWKMNTAANTSDDRQKPLDNLGVIWNI